MYTEPRDQTTLKTEFVKKYQFTMLFIQRIGDCHLIDSADMCCSVYLGIHINPKFGERDCSYMVRGRLYCEQLVHSAHLQAVCSDI